MYFYIENNGIARKIIHNAKLHINNDGGLAYYLSVAWEMVAMPGGMGARRGSGSPIHGSLSQNRPRAAGAAEIIAIENEMMRRGRS